MRDLAEHKVAQAIHNYVCQTGDPIRQTADVFRLAPRARDARFFCSHIQTEAATVALPDPRALRDAQARMIENATLFRQRLTDLSEDQRRRLTIYIAQRCYLVIVAASDQDAAFRIFSVLNSRDLDLSPADILKAEVVGALPEAAQEKYNTIWEDLEEDLGRTRFAELFSHIRTIHRKQKMQGTPQLSPHFFHIESVA